LESLTAQLLSFGLTCSRILLQCDLSQPEKQQHAPNNI